MRPPSTLAAARLGILAAALAATPAPGACQESSRIPEADRRAAKDISQYLTRLEGFAFAGNVLVTRRGAALSETSHGLADRRSATPWHAETIFDIGSITKQFTAAAIVDLESQGKLLVTDSVALHLRGDRSAMRGITLHQLLTHTSGLPMGPGGDYERLSRDGMIRMAFSEEPVGAPGERHAYSNIGYSVLAAVVEVVSGTDYDSYLRQRFFRPLGMTSTGYTPSPQDAPRLARGYVDDEEWGIGAEKAAATGGQYWNLIGNGGIHSTVGDMQRWISALTQGRILTDAAREEYLRPHVTVSSNYLGTGNTLSYAYGWYVSRTPSGRTMIWHLGGNGIFNAAVRWHVDDRSTVIYATNVAAFGDPAYPVPAIERMLAGESVLMPPRMIMPTRSQLDALAGEYATATGEALSIERSDSFLKVSGEGQGAFTFVASRRWQSDTLALALNAATARAVESSRARRYDELRELFPTATTRDELERVESLFWSKRHTSFGDYRRTRVLGTTLTPNRRLIGRSIVAIDFERGTVYREYFWTGDRRIGDLGPTTAAPFARFFAETADCFATIDPATADVARLCFTTATGRRRTARVIDGKNQIELVGAPRR